MLKKIITLSLPLTLAACAYGQLGALNERYGFFGTAPNDFVSAAPATIGTYKFLGIGRVANTETLTHEAYYFDPKPLEVKKDGGLIIKTYAYTNKPAPTKNKLSYNSKIELVYLNCNNRTFTETVSKLYSSKDATGKPVYVEDNKNSYTPVAISPNNLDRILFEKVCKQKF